MADRIYQPVYEERGLAGAVYSVTADEDIYTPDGTLRIEAGEVKVIGEDVGDMIEGVLSVFELFDGSEAFGDSIELRSEDVSEGSDGKAGLRFGESASFTDAVGVEVVDTGSEGDDDI